MDNMHDQARAIWNALDNLLEQSPEEYSRFLMEQLQEGKKMVEHEKRKGSSSANATQFDDLPKAFEKLQLGVKQSGVNSTPKSTNVDKVSNTVQPLSLHEQEKIEYNDCGTCSSLLDDDIGGNKSILSNIVKNRSDEFKDDELELNICISSGSTDSASGKLKKPLIEEI